VENPCFGHPHSGIKKERTFRGGDAGREGVDKSTVIPPALTGGRRKSFPDRDLFHRGGKGAETSIQNGLPIVKKLWNQVDNYAFSWIPIVGENSYPRMHHPNSNSYFYKIINIIKYYGRY
jgi:hypothetical protein